MIYVDKVEFPDEFIDPNKKKEAPFCMQSAKAFHQKFANTGPAFFLNKANYFQELRSYANGRQSIDKYKKRVGVRSDYGKDNKSWRNINWEILPIAPRFKHVVAGKVMNSMGGIRVKAIDPISLERERQHKARLQEYVINKQFLQEITKATGIEFESPIDPGIPEPNSLDDIQMHMNMFYKDRLSMDFQDAIQLVLQMNNWKQSAHEVILDLLEVGNAGTRTYIDKDNQVRIRRCIPERLGVYGHSGDDFKNAKAVWEYLDVTMKDLISMTRGKFSKEQYDDMMNKGSIYQFNTASSQGDPYQEQNNYSVGNSANDKRVTIMDLRFISVDTWIHQTGTNQYGNRTITRKPFGWYDPQKIYPDSWADERAVFTNEVQNIYQCKWVVGTDYVFDFGKSTDIERDPQNPTVAGLGYTLYTTQDQSMIESMKPVFDAIQLNWLQYQSHSAKSRPAGLEIEMSAFEDINLGKGFEKMSPRDIIAMSYDTGILVWRRKDWSGNNSNWKPINDLKAILPEGALLHLQNIVTLISLLRDISGLNEVVDGSTPRPDIGKTVSELAAINSNNALYYLHHGFDSIYERTARSIALLIPESIKRGPVQGLVNSLGTNTVQFIKANSDIPYYQFGINIEHKPDPEMKAKLSMYVQISLDRMEITAEDAFRIEAEGNIYRAANMLYVKRKQRSDERMQEEQMKNQMLIDSQTASNEQAAQNEAQSLQAQSKAKIEEETVLSDIRRKESREKFQQDFLLEKYRKGEEMKEHEKEILAKLLMTKETNETTITVAAMKVAQAAQQKKDQAKKPVKAK